MDAFDNKYFTNEITTVNSVFEAAPVLEAAPRLWTCEARCLAN